MNTYTVKSGDTLLSIAQDLYGDADYAIILAQLNGIVDGDSIKAGQLIALPLDEVTVSTKVKIWPVVAAGVVIAVFIGWLIYKYNS